MEKNNDYFTPRPHLPHLSISFNCGSDLFRSRCNREHGFGFDSFTQRLLGNGHRPTHVFVAAVGATANQTFKQQHLL